MGERRPARRRRGLPRVRAGARAAGRGSRRPASAITTGRRATQIDPEQRPAPEPADRGRCRRRPPAVLDAIQASWDDVRKRARVLAGAGRVGVDGRGRRFGRARPSSSSRRRPRSRRWTGSRRTTAVGAVDLLERARARTGSPGGSSRPCRRSVPSGRTLRAAIEDLRTGRRAPRCTDRWTTRRRRWSARSIRRSINGVVVLTDGKNDYSEYSSVDPLARAPADQPPDRAVRVFCIAYGDDADMDGAASRSPTPRSAPRTTHPTPRRSRTSSPPSSRTSDGGDHEVRGSRRRGDRRRQRGGRARGRRGRCPSRSAIGAVALAIADGGPIAPPCGRPRPPQERAAATRRRRCTPTSRARVARAEGAVLAIRRSIRLADAGPLRERLRRGRERGGAGPARTCAGSRRT